MMNGLEFRFLYPITLRHVAIRYCLYSILVYPAVRKYSVEIRIYYRIIDHNTIVLILANSSLARYMIRSEGLYLCKGEKIHIVSLLVAAARCRMMLAD